jgi:hypothetical protein
MRSLLVSVAALALMLVSAAAAEAAPDASLRIVDRDPLTFKGRHFHAGERVRLEVTLKRVARTHKVRANASGTFTTVFAGLAWQRCGGGNLAVEATGSRGSHVEFTVLALHCVQSPRA